ncbi:hypothetical protein IQ272_07265 [Chroococcidiopsidales cyanobacterium LEGE 13417]|uniref:hypothetical protein n=1 Tax=Chroococcidiopsis sp. CCALA 051 TaxID=869949 RepID=UPI001304B971|nr:hypothetical protein [Chroococcidiopsis sp. CCALA 051]MBE9015933.1 hypothetical protein [Chroococcidiopsidales cyanobacterium LEGE 13417]
MAPVNLASYLFYLHQQQLVLSTHDSTFLKKRSLYIEFNLIFSIAYNMLPFSTLVFIP